MEQNLSDRFLEFAVKIIELGKLLNKTFEGRHIYGQLFRAGTSTGANYEEGCSAESRPDFVHKFQIVLKELREARFWLRLIKKSKLIPQDNPDLISLLKGNDELLNIIGKSVVTAKRNKL